MFAQTNFYTENYRPRFHFSPQTNWCNDPNGLVYNNGEFHLFYQHNPFGNVWGHMTWGHATSKDLIHWEHLPNAIAEENEVMIFSGSCVVDEKNTSGFATKPGQVPMVAIYTGHIENKNQSQHIAYSLDNGVTWTKYKKNPVLDLHKKDFRDPKVFWYEPKKYWVMLLMLPGEHIMQIYSSYNLKDWKHLSDFGPAGDVGGVWECPDLVQVPVVDQPTQKKWLLQTSQNPTMQYFVGEFDGVRFINENPAGKIFRPDYGPDYYAAISYNHLPDNIPPTAIGWLNNWNYANDIPTTPWKGAMSLPRNLAVKKEGDHWLLVQHVAEEVKKLRGQLFQVKDRELNGILGLPINVVQCEIELELKTSVNGSAKVRIAGMEIGYDLLNSALYIDRGGAGNDSFNANFKKLHRYEVPYSLKNDLLRLHIFVDHSIVEIFADDGEIAMTAQFFPEENEFNGLEIIAFRSHVNMLNIWKMNAAW